MKLLIARVIPLETVSMFQLARNLSMAQFLGNLSVKALLNMVIWFCFYMYGFQVLKKDYLFPYFCFPELFKSSKRTKIDPPPFLNFRKMQTSSGPCEEPSVY